MIMMMMLIMMIMIGSDQAVYTFISSHRIEREVSNASSKHSLVIVPLLFWAATKTFRHWKLYLHQFRQHKNLRLVYPTYVNRNIIMSLFKHGMWTLRQLPLSISLAVFLSLPLYNNCIMHWYSIIAYIVDNMGPATNTARMTSQGLARRRIRRGWISGSFALNLVLFSTVIGFWL